MSLSTYGNEQKENNLDKINKNNKTKKVILNKEQDKKLLKDNIKTGNNIKIIPFYLKYKTSGKKRNKMRNEKGEIKTENGKIVDLKFFSKNKFIIKVEEKIKK